jgi:hypothetical protein
MKERVDEIDAEQHGDRQADDGLKHVAFLSEAPAGARIEAHQREDNHAEADIDEIEHVWSPYRQCLKAMPVKRIKALFRFPQSGIRAA